MGNHSFPKPPRVLSQLFELIARSEEKRTISGDLDELFADLVQERGRLKATLWYGGQVLGACPLLLFNSLYWRVIMLINYLKITIRNIRRHKAYSFINIAGLAIGIASCMLIMLWVQDEVSYDRFHEHADSLYVATFSNGSLVTPTALSGFLKEQYPEVLHTSRFAGMGKNLLKYENTEINEEGGVMVDPDFVKMFTIPFLGGNRETSLDEPRSILISEKLALKYFGNKDPIGETMTFAASIDLKVTGVFEDYPSNSHITFEYILPFVLSKLWNRDLNTWEVNNIRTYVQLHEGTPVKSVDSKISDVVERHRPQDQRPLSLQPVTQLRLNPYRGRGTLTYVYLFSAMAFFILLIACINFINLTTAKSSTRAKEVGVRKTVGACRVNLIRQFFGESLFLTMIATALGIGLAVLLLPRFNTLSGKTFTWEVLLQQSVLFGISCILLLTVLIAGSYPALFLSRFQAARVLTGKLKTGMKGGMLRKVLVVVQFSLSVFLVLGTVMIYRQVRFMQEHDLGYDREHVVTFDISGQIIQNRDTIKTELLSNPGILHMTLVDIAPHRWQSNAGVGDVHWEGKTNQQVKMVMTSVDYDFLDTFGLEMAEGRFFSKEYSTDESESFVVNQAAVKAMEMDDPIGKELRVWDYKRKIIGVVKDYHFESLRNPIIPMAMRIDPRWYQQACVRISPLRVSDTLSFIEKKWKELHPRYPFEYQFLDDMIHSLYRSEQSIGTVVTVFTVLALFISCLGIFGLSSYTAEQRTKEIGIRKVLGASVSSIVKHMSKEFVFLVIIANVIAWPLAYFLLNQWLQRFAYRIAMGWWTFVMVGIMIFVLSLLTISWQIIRAATANPVDSLRYE
jgi:predicted permease